MYFLLDVGLLVCMFLALHLPEAERSGVKPYEWEEA